MAIACARRCRSSQLTESEKNYRKKLRVEEEERHKGLLTQKNTKTRQLHTYHLLFYYDVNFLSRCLLLEA
jgi:hypothetical protein